MNNVIILPINGLVSVEALTGLSALLSASLLGCSPTPELAERAASQYNVITADDANEDIATYVLPQDTAILDEPNADEIFYGKRLLNETKRLLQ